MALLNGAQGPKCPLCGIIEIRLYKVNREGKEIECCRDCKRSIVRQQREALEKMEGLNKGEILTP